MNDVGFDIIYRFYSQTLSPRTKKAIPAKMRYLPAVTAIFAVPALADTVKITASDDEFKPETVTAKKGDILEFHFGAGNHSVAMGDFDSINGPCVPANEGGFFSGYFDVESGESVGS